MEGLEVPKHVAAGHAIVDRDCPHRTTGSLNVGRTVLLWPFFLFQWCYVSIAFLIHLTIASGWNPADSSAEVASGLFVGDIMASAFDNSWDAVLDITNELPRLSSSQNYHCIPTWDGTAPTVQQLDEACDYIGSLVKKKNENAHILIHCAHGKGRSVTVTTAVLVGLGIEPDWRSAYSRVRAHRRQAHLNRVMQQRLEDWETARRRKM
ncbi:conserved hypothetical protein [Perkinsus marinus ATCC 50983]|uniref:Tyrosine specific protein phosphatases domain-containing protein n=1 Tax=Perkinsus marinus (strain ATCC 50983 / TXsc) TaxID=423536 RepID=C5KHC2_PERM5|nr:conserved hypothetical protein [Perkinsus marinus ATCC 50983]EER15984.1 conserved hypothetical protein [Perkinsus marinus ATCC 50983]|eukprot:XP_002784188.1 conserved hypothetical protein [Perkinsus marinus ATCC 50983]